MIFILVDKAITDNNYVMCEMDYVNRIHTNKANNAVITRYYIKRHFRN